MKAGGQQAGSPWDECFEAAVQLARRAGQVSKRHRRPALPRIRAGGQRFFS